MKILCVLALGSLFSIAMGEAHGGAARAAGGPRLC